MKTMEQLLLEWRQVTFNMEKLKSDSPRVLGLIAVKVIKNNFKLQGYEDGYSFTPWKARAPKTDAAYSRNRGKGESSNYKGSVYNAKNPILQQTRTLYNSVKAIIQAGGIVFVGVNLDLAPYAQRHNEGLKGMPERKFMPVGGPNATMLGEFEKKITEKRDEIMHNFKP
jgi:hypothetical protein